MCSNMAYLFNTGEAWGKKKAAKISLDLQGAWHTGVLVKVWALESPDPKSGVSRTLGVQETLGTYRDISMPKLHFLPFFYFIVCQQVSLISCQKNICFQG